MANEILQDIKAQLAVWDEDQRVMGNKINHLIGVVNRTNQITLPLSKDYSTSENCLNCGDSMDDHCYDCLACNPDCVCE